MPAALVPFGGQEYGAYLGRHPWGNMRKGCEVPPEAGVDGEPALACRTGGKRGIPFASLASC